MAKAKARGFTKGQIGRLARLRAAEHRAYRARRDYQQRLEDVCKHDLLFERSYGWTDTLGNYVSGRGTSEWHCALCAKQILSIQNSQGVPVTPDVRGKTIHIPGSALYGGADPRTEVLSNAPQTAKQVIEQLTTKYPVIGDFNRKLFGKHQSQKR